MSGLLHSAKLMNTKAQSDFVHHRVARQQDTGRWRGLCQTALASETCCLMTLAIECNRFPRILRSSYLRLKNSKHCARTDDLLRGAEISYSNCLLATEGQRVRFSRSPCSSEKHGCNLWLRLAQEHVTGE